MTKTKERVSDAADSIRPYVERAMSDEKLRGDVMRAFGTARELYGELLGEKRRPIALASRVATDDDIRDKVREAIEDLRDASERLQGKRERSGGRKSTLLIAGLARAMSDEKLRGGVMRAFGTARELYGELLGEKGRPIALASRVATDDDIRGKVREAIEDLRKASERLQGKRERSGGRKSTLLIAGLALGILFNPVTGGKTRRFIKNMLSAGGHSAGHSAASG